MVVAGQRDTLEGEAGEVLGPFRTAEVGTDQPLTLQRTAQSSLQACRGSGWNWATSYEAPVVVQARGDGDLDEAWTDVLWRLNQQDSRMNHVGGRAREREVPQWTPGVLTTALEGTVRRVC